MSKEWFNAAGFERFHQLISAINSVLIHTKLVLAGVDDSERRDEFEAGRDYLLSFLEEFGPILQEIEKDENYVPVGTDPRLEGLARSLATMKRRRPRILTIATVSITDLKPLLQMNDVDSASKVIGYLTDLRSILEQEAHADVISILGEL